MMHASHADLNTYKTAITLVRFLPETIRSFICMVGLCFILCRSVVTSWPYSEDFLISQYVRESTAVKNRSFSGSMTLRSATSVGGFVALHNIFGSFFSLQPSILPALALDDNFSPHSSNLSFMPSSLCDYHFQKCLRVDPRLKVLILSCVYVLSPGIIYSAFFVWT